MTIDNWVSRGSLQSSCPGRMTALAPLSPLYLECYPRGYIMDPALSLNQSVILSSLQSNGSGDALYQLQWRFASPNSYYFLPTAASYSPNLYSFVTSDTISQLLAPSYTEIATGIWVLQGATVTVTMLNVSSQAMELWECYNSTMGVWVYVSWPQAVLTNCLGAIQGGNFSFIQGTTVARLINPSTQQLTYIPITNPTSNCHNLHRSLHWLHVRVHVG